MRARVLWPTGVVLDRTSGLAWIGLDWIGLDWIGLDWIGLDWIGFSWFRLRLENPPVGDAGAFPCGRRCSACRHRVDKTGHEGVVAVT